MHSNLTTTDGVYGDLSENDVRGQIAAMDQKMVSGEEVENEKLVPLLEQLLAELKQKKSN